METSMDVSMKSYMKGALSTSSIPMYHGHVSSTYRSGQGPSKGQYRSVCTGLNESQSSFSNKTARSSSRPSSIPRLIPLTDSQKKGYLLRTIIARKLRETGTAENCPPNDDATDRGAPKRPRLIRPAIASIRFPASSTSSIASLTTGSDIDEKRGQKQLERNQATLVQKVAETQTASLRGQIAKFFGTSNANGGVPMNLEPLSPDSDCFDPIQPTIDHYVLEIFMEELKNEARNYPPTCTKELERQITKRTDAVNWVRRAGVALKLIYQTIHVATYIVDAYLRRQTLPYYALELFSAAALFIAAKQEETDFTMSAETILKQCSSALRYTPTRLVGMEAKILNKLKFKICCPTSQFFMETCASQMTYLNQFYRKFTIALAECLLFHSLGESELMFSTNSNKARLALYYSVKYVSYNFELLMAVHGKERGIWDKFRMKCFPEFRSAVLSGISLPKSLASFNTPPKLALRDMTNKGCRRASQPKTLGHVLPVSRTTRIK